MVREKVWITDKGARMTFLSGSGQGEVVTGVLEKRSEDTMAEVPRTLWQRINRDRKSEFGKRRGDESGG
jgi:hypothetical protein